MSSTSLYDVDDSILVVAKHNGNNAPNGWTKITGQDLIARRVALSDADKLRIVGKKLVLAAVYRKNPGSPNSFCDELAGNSSYGFESTPDGKLIASKQDSSGGQAKSTRFEFGGLVHGGGAPITPIEEEWSKDSGQVPISGSVFEDAAPSTQLYNAAKAFDPNTIPLG